MLMSNGNSAKVEDVNNGGFTTATTFQSPQEITRAKRGDVAGAEGLTLGKFPSDLGIHFMSFNFRSCLLYTSPSPRDKRQSRMPSSA